jgi:hypothetical protein
MNIFCKVACALFLLCFTFQTATAQKSISKKDKQAIIDIFEDVDKSQFIMYFNDGKEVYGKKRIKMSDLKMDKKWTKYAGKSVKWTVIVGDRSANEVIYIYTEGMNEMVSLLGREKVKALMAIADKYPNMDPSGRR